LASQLLVKIKAGKASEALDLFRGLPQDRVPPMLRLAAARACVQLNDAAGATEQWRRALRDTAASSMNAVGSVAADLRDILPEAQVTQLLQAVADSIPADLPPGQRLRIALADSLGRSQHGADAITLLNQVIESAPQKSGEMLAALLTRGQIQEQSQDYAAAIKSYQQVLEAYPEQLAALNNLAYLLADTTAPGLPRVEEALKYAERLEGLIQDNPNAANMLDTIGWVYFRYGTSQPDRRAYIERGSAVLEQALSLNDETLPALEHLGQVYDAMGRGADAREKLNRGRELAARSGNAEFVKRFDAALQKLP